MCVCVQGRVCSLVFLVAPLRIRRKLTQNLEGSVAAKGVIIYYIVLLSWDFIKFVWSMSRRVVLHQFGLTLSEQQSSGMRLFQNFFKFLEKIWRLLFSWEFITFL